MMTEADIQQLLNSSRKSDITQVSQQIVSGALPFETLLRIIESGSVKVAKHAAWVISYVAQENVTILIPFFEELTLLVKKSDDYSIVGAVLYAFKYHERLCDEHSVGDIYEFCVQNCVNKKYKDYVKAICVELMLLITKGFPELRQETLAAAELSLETIESIAVQRSVKKKMEKLLG